MITFIYIILLDYFFLLSDHSSVLFVNFILQHTFLFVNIYFDILLFIFVLSVIFHLIVEYSVCFVGTFHTKHLLNSQFPIKKPAEHFILPAYKLNTLLKYSWFSKDKFSSTFFSHEYVVFTDNISTLHYKVD